MFGIRQKALKWLNRKRCWRTLDSKLKRPLDLEALRDLDLARNQRYGYCDYYFSHFLPLQVRQHRRFFGKNGRGFGEDAFHAMWFLLFQSLRPSSALEIGVYRGQTITLWKLLSRHFGFNCDVACVSPFTSAGDSVSSYLQNIDYYEDVVRNHREFNLSLPNFCKGLSTSPEGVAFVRSREWQVIYIDGNHEYEIAKRDWEVCSQRVTVGGVIVLDDSALGTDYEPPGFATAGHPGPSRVAREIDSERFCELFSAGHNRVFQRIG